MRIMYNAMLMKTSASSYLRYRVWTLQAARNLFPSGCTEFNTVKAAWNAVSVPAQSDEPTCGGGSTTPPPSGCTGSNGTDVTIPDAGHQLHHHLRVRTRRRCDVDSDGRDRPHVSR